MKKKTFLTICSIILLSASVEKSSAQVPIVSVITGLIKKVVQALDLEIQRLQTQTIWLQNAQKTLENTMSELDLDGIRDWVQKQKDLFREYYGELWQVKQIISDYDKVKKIIQRQEQILAGYKKVIALFQQDKNFSPQELDYMQGVYSGILDQSLKNIDQLMLVVNAFTTQMTDGERINIIDQAALSMEKNYQDLKQFSNQNIELSLQRAAENDDLETVKKLYGLE
jgi:hypothetical protein